MQMSFKLVYSRYKSYFLDIVSLYKQKPDFKKYLELFLSLIAVAVFSFFAIKPTMITIINLTKEIKAKEDTLEKMDEKIENLKNAQNVFYQQKSAIDILNMAIPSSPSLETAIRQIETSINTNTITPGNITYSSVTIKGADQIKRSKEETQGLPDKTKVIVITLGGKGTYESIKGFLSNMENMRRPLKIDSFSVSQKALLKTEVSSELSFSLMGRVPYYGTIEILQIKPSPNNEQQ